MNVNAYYRTRILEHGWKLKRAFYLPEEVDALALCKKLRKLDIQETQHSEDLCNGVIDPTDAELAARVKQTLNAVDKLLCFRVLGIPVFINGDPRGYALKIDDKWMREHPECDLPRDMGGYGLIAPNLAG